MTGAEVERAILGLLAERSPGATICPSEAARYLSPEDWRPLMPEIRRVAAAMARAGRLRILQRGVEIAPDEMRGPIRLGAPI